MERLMTRPMLIIAACVLALLTTACRQDDAKRPTAFTPGVYSGEPMPTLSAQQVEDLQKRGLLLR